MTDENPASPEWTSFAARHRVGDVVTATVTNVVPFGCFVEVDTGIPGLLREVRDVTVGDRVAARIESLDEARQRVAYVRA